MTESYELAHTYILLCMGVILYCFQCIISIFKQYKTLEPCNIYCTLNLPLGHTLKVFVCLQ